MSGTGSLAPTMNLYGLAQNEADGLWPSLGNKQGWDPKVEPLEPIYDARKDETAKKVGELTLDSRRTMEAEITNRAIAFIKRNAAAHKPFYAYVSSSVVHMPVLPGRTSLARPVTGTGQYVLAEMDYRTGQILDAVHDAGIEDNTIVVFCSDNGPEGTDPWQGELRPMARNLLHGDGGVSPRPLHYSLAGKDSCGSCL